MRFLERFENAKKIWELALPTVSLPPNETMIGWLAVYTDEEFEAAVVRTPYRLSQGIVGRGEIDPEKVYRLLSSMLKDGHKRARRDARSESSNQGCDVPQSIEKGVECSA